MERRQHLRGGVFFGLLGWMDGWITTTSIYIYNFVVVFLGGFFLAQSAEYQSGKSIFFVAFCLAILHLFIFILLVVVVVLGYDKCLDVWIVFYFSPAKRSAIGLVGGFLCLDGWMGLGLIECVSVRLVVCIV
ncbi:hypothetical protein T440DRAFT_224206 [Plenodomus tracheiphilus IPT5]|uniref:Transmembrane protein n=1 Tax=Plenodomus tracheiphilus IPT5 TaxID=1408161 RepID=A0A6A7ATF7_9PLEO|nr:hypothetical protein T440DRAFT_224206 [Plenodomus tracheiphilus IPT5]